MKQDSGHAPWLRNFSKVWASPSGALFQGDRSVVRRAEVGLSAQLDLSIAGESFSAHVNQQRLEALRQIVRHRAVSSAIIGPLTMDHLETDLAADDIDVSCELLDRIDEAGPPGHHAARVVDDVWSAAVWRRIGP
jgi:aryl-alcohol dehydrogenase-like predicted oxidoreductase